MGKVKTHHTMNTPEQIKQAAEAAAKNYIQFTTGGKTRQKAEEDFTCGYLAALASRTETAAPKPVQNDAFVEWLEKKVKGLSDFSDYLKGKRSAARYTYLSLIRTLAKYKELSESGGEGLKTEAVEFAKWLYENYDRYDGLWKPRHMSDKTYSAAQLYDIWKQLPKPPINK